MSTLRQRSSLTPRRRQESLARALRLENLEPRQLMASEIFGSVVLDLNQNGVRNAGEDRLAGWLVFLDSDRDGVHDAGESSSITDQNGDYSLSGLAAGTHRIVEEMQPGWRAVTPISKDVFVDVNKKTRSDFFVFAGGDIVGTMWNDLDNSGDRSVDEPPLSGWTVYLDLNQNSLKDPTEPSRLTDHNGEFRFDGLPAGDYEVTEILPLGWDAARRHGTAVTAAVVALGETSIEFANFSDTNGGIKGVVFNDLNADGVRNVNSVTGEFIEPGIVGRSLYIDANENGTLDADEVSALTDSDGEYLFASLVAGTYRVAEELPGGWEMSPDTLAYQSVFVSPGDVVTADPFGNFTTRNGSISGMVWNDLNHDGVRDVNTITGAFIDPALSNWDVFLDLNRNSLMDAGEPAAVTNLAGMYTFADLQIGEYKVQQKIRTGWEVAPTFNDSQTIVVISGVDVTAADFAVYDASASAPGSLGGTIWNDVNLNGAMEADEVGLSGRQVYLDLNANGAKDATEPGATTDALGNYGFTGITAGSILVRVSPTSGWIPTFPTSSGRTVALRGGETLTGLNFGQRQVMDASIDGFVFADTNKNGVRDAGERGLAGLTMYIDTNNNGTLELGEPTSVTNEDLFYTPSNDESGSYSFTHLPAGSYTVRAILPAILSNTPAAELVHNVTLGTGESRTGVSVAAQFRRNEIHGLKYEDLNGNHVREVGEPPMVDATVYLDLNRNDSMDLDEPRVLTGEDGSYSFLDLGPGSYVVRTLHRSGHSHSYPRTLGGDLWPDGTSNPASGIVTPTSITKSLVQGESYRQMVSITLPNTGSLSDMVDVFLLFDDTGSFTGNSPIVRSAFPTIISQLTAALPGANLGFGVGRMEEYGSFAFEYDTGRPFTLNQPIVAESTPGYMASIQAALNRTTPGYGGDGPETDIEALYQLVTGRGFDGNNNGTMIDSGPAGLAATQLNPGNSGDVPSFASFTPDPANLVLPASGNVGGAGFRAGALPIILMATDTGFAYQPKGETSIVGLNGVNLPLSALTQTSRNTTPFGAGAGIQETITGLNALGALVIGLGTNPEAAVDPRQQLEAISKLTGATNQSTATIANGTSDPIAPGDPLYFQIATGFASSVANGVVSAIQNAATNVAVNIDVKASDPRVRIINHSGVVSSIGAGMTANFDVEFIGDGRPHRFDLQFVRAGTDVVLGSIPVVLGTPISGDGYHYDDLEDGEIEFEDDFGDMSSSSVAPSLVVSGPQDGYAGVTYQSRDVHLTAVGSGSGSFNYEMLWGDGSPLEVVSGTSGMVVSHAFASVGNYAATFRVSDSSGLFSDWMPLNFAIRSQELQGTVLAISGTSVDNQLTMTPGAAAPSATLLLDSTSLGTVNLPSGGVKFFGGSGNDRVTMVGTTGNDLYTLDASQLQWSGSAVWTQALTFAHEGVEGFRVLGNAGNDQVVIQQGQVEFQGGAGTDSLIGSNSDNAWSLSGSGSGSLNGVPFTGVETVTGGTGNDTFTYGTTGAIAGVLAGGGGTDTIDYTARTTAVSVNLSTRRATGSLSFTDVERFLAGTATTDLVTAANVPNQWTLADGLNATLNGTIFLQGFERLTGGTSTDHVTIPAGLVGGPTLNTGSGIDTISYADWTQPVVINRSLNTGTALAGLSGAESFIGGSASDTWIGPNATTAWKITSTGVGLAGASQFSSFEHVAGGSLNDTFTFSPGAMLESVTGGGGTDTLVGASVNNDWVVNEIGAGSLNATMAFAGIENLTGGTAEDRFQIEPTGQVAGTLSGGTGVNTLSYQNWTSSIVIDNVLKQATQVGVLALNFGILIGGSGDDTMSAVNTLSSILIGNGGNDRLTGSDLRRDLLIGGQGSDTLDGRGGDDLLVSGQTTFDQNAIGLRALLAEWNSSRTYAQRVNNLRGTSVTGTPLNGGSYLRNAPMDTLIDDGVADILTGGLGNDWFLAMPSDSITDAALTELIDTL